jgi:hypothetical protein
MRVLYLVNQQPLAQYFLRGWKNSFEALGDQVDCLDYSRQSVSDFLINVPDSTHYDIIMSASNEGILSIPVERINEMGAALVVNALPFNSFRITPDPQAPNANEREVKHIAKFERKLIWSQWIPEYVDYFYEGYRRLGIPVMSMPYGADITSRVKISSPIEAPELDIMFVGNLRHRAKGNLPIFRSLFNLSSPERIGVYGDAAWKENFGNLLGDIRYTNSRDDLAKMYRSARISPNLHTARQVRDHIQINDRIFQIAGFKGFQIADTNLVSEFYASDEIPCTENTDQYLTWAKEFILYPERRISYIEKAYKRTVQSHTWFNRIAQIYELLGIKDSVMIGTQRWVPFCFDTATKEQRKIQFDRFLYYFLESSALRLGRGIKRFLAQ